MQKFIRNPVFISIYFLCPTSTIHENFKREHTMIKTGKIIAIGGGEIGRTKILEDGSVKKYPIETREIDAEIVRLTGKSSPKLLFIGTASGDSPTYFEAVDKYFTIDHGCKCSALNILSNPPLAEIKKAVFNTDIVYVGGGNTNSLIKAWKSSGLDKVLEEALNNGVVLSGLSAGANCWFKHYCTDSAAIELGAENGTHLDMRNGLGFIGGICAPHTLTETLRLPYVKNVLKNNYPSETVYAIDDYTALIWENGQIRSIRSGVGKEKNASTKKLTIKSGEIIEEKLFQ